MGATKESKTPPDEMKSVRPQRDSLSPISSTAHRTRFSWLHRTAPIVFTCKVFIHEMVVLREGRSLTSYAVWSFLNDSPARGFPMFLSGWTNTACVFQARNGNDKRERMISTSENPKINNYLTFLRYSFFSAERSTHEILGMPRVS